MKVPDSFQIFSKITPYTQTNLIKSLFIIFVLWFTRFIVLRFVFRRMHKVRTRSLWKEIINYVTILSGIILLGHLWIKEVKSILTFLVVIATGLTLVLKEILLNFAANFIIIWRGLFNVGNRIQVGDNIGDVIEIGPFYFTLIEVGRWVDADQSTGRIIKIPNCMVLTQPSINYSRGLPYIWNEISILITLDSNWKRAKEILCNIGNKNSKIVSEAAKKFLQETEREVIVYRKLTPTVYLKIKAEGIMLTLRYLCLPRNRRDSEHKLWEGILEELSHNNDITLVQK
jgi:small-conductance mechanosensitive channel